MVFVNNQPVRATPADYFHVYNGKYNIMVVKEGFETLKVNQNIPPRWYEYWPLDFISEIAIPWTIRDVRVFPYKLQPAQMPCEGMDLQEGGILRGRAETIGGPPALRHLDNKAD